MATGQAVIWNGEDGEVWTNDTAAPQYQLIVNWHNTCGLCAQYDHAIGPSWPLPFHHHCRCKQIVILPGARAQPWVDFRAIAEGLDGVQKRDLIGASNYKLLKDGLVDWKDIVTQYRVRDFREVVALKKLSVKQLTGAGVKPGIAQRAHAAVHTPAHQIAEAVRQQLLANLMTAGLAPHQIAKLGAEGLAARLGIRAGATVTGKLVRVSKSAAPAPLRGPAQRPKKQPDANRLRDFLGGWGLPAAAAAAAAAAAEAQARKEAEAKDQDKNKPGHHD